MLIMEFSRYIYFKIFGPKLQQGRLKFQRNILDAILFLLESKSVNLGTDTIRSTLSFKDKRERQKNTTSHKKNRWQAELKALYKKKDNSITQTKLSI